MNSGNFPENPKIGCCSSIPRDRTATRTLGCSSENACRYSAEKGDHVSCVITGNKDSVVCTDDTFHYAAPVWVLVIGHLIHVPLKLV